MNKKRSGIVLISILVLTLVATFFIGALLQMNPGRLRQTVHDENRDRAARAAEAGVEYALNRLKVDPDWVPDSNREVVVGDDLVIREDEGNLLGWIRTESGAWAGFRLRFNHQDGDGGADGLDDPAFPIASKEISLNNLGASTARAVPVGDGPEFQPGGNVGVVVPPHAVALLVEGVVAPELDPEQPATLAEAQAARTLEGIFGVSSVTADRQEDAALMVGGQATVVVGARPPEGELKPGRDPRGVLSLRSSSDNQAAIRVKEQMALERRSGDNSGIFDPDQDAQVLVGSGSFVASTVDGTIFSGGAEDEDDAFLRVAWEKMKKTEQADPIKLPGGVYVFSDGARDGGRTLTDAVKYFDMTWPEYKQAVESGAAPSPQTLPPAFASRVNLDAESVQIGGESELRDTIVFEKDVEVEPSRNGTADLSIIPERGARLQAPVAGGGGFDPFYISGGSTDTTVPQDIQITFAPSAEVESAFIRSQGSILLGAHLSGSGGGVVAKGNVNLIGSGIDLHGKPKNAPADSLTIYSRAAFEGDHGVLVSTYDERRNRFWDLDLIGSIFTNKSMMLNLGQPADPGGLPAPEWGVFAFEGVMVSLGQARAVDAEIDLDDLNPGGTGRRSFTPGEPGFDSGNAWVLAEGVSLYYDPRFLVPYVEDEELNLTFSPLSVTER